jgi:hypothetical protein
MGVEIVQMAVGKARGGHRVTRQIRASINSDGFPGQAEKPP